MGMMALAAGVKVANPQDAVPQLILKMFPGWFAGFCFAAIAIGALVPAAVMSIGAANTFTRNMWKPFVNPAMTPAEESFVAKLISLIVKLGALAFILFVQPDYAVDLQLLGGIWMVQIFPAIIFGLFTRWFTGPALLIGWAAGMIVGTALSWPWAANARVAVIHSLAWDIPALGHLDLGLGFAVYNGFTAFLVNVVLAAIVSALWRRQGADETQSADYEDARLPA
jgi:SSS family solute:Na+ symporter